MVTVLEALTRENPVLDTRGVSPGPNTTVKDTTAPDGWIPWTDFTYESLTTIFSKHLQTKYSGPMEDIPLPLDLSICNEDTFAVALHRFVMPTVNRCLNSVSSTAHLGPGSRCPDGKAIPDWSCIAHNQYYNYVPGDTKLSAKFWPDMINSHYKEWSKVLGQITFYQSHFGSRYGFIITDDLLLVLRTSYLRTGTGLSAVRPTRLVVSEQTGDYEEDGDTSFANTTLSYVDNNALNHEKTPSEYAIVPWNERRPRRLTVKLALWCLAMLGTGSPNYIDYSYPVFNSWRMEELGYFHNATGAFKTRASRHDIIQGPDPDNPDHWINNASMEPSGSHGNEGEASTGSDFSGHADEDSNEEGGEDDDVVGESNESSLLTRLNTSLNIADDDDAAAGASSQLPKDELASYDEAEAGDSDESDVQTVTTRSLALNDVRTIEVVIKKRKILRTLYFIDARGRETDTKRSEWKKVSLYNTWETDAWTTPSLRTALFRSGATLQAAGAQSGFFLDTYSKAADLVREAGFVNVVRVRVKVCHNFSGGVRE